MDRTLDHRAALRAEELGPARRVAPFVRAPPIRRFPALYGHRADGGRERSEWLHALGDIRRNDLDFTGDQGNGIPMAAPVVSGLATVAARSLGQSGPVH